MEDMANASIYYFFSKVCFVFFLASITSALLFLRWKRPVKFTLYFIIIFLFFLQRFLISNFDCQIGPEVALLIYETNSVEASGFLSTFAFCPATIKCYLQVAMVILFIVFLEFIGKKQARLHLPRVFKVVVSLLCFMMFSIGGIHSKVYLRLFNCNDMEELARWQGSERTRFSDLVTKVMYSIEGLRITGNEIKRASDVILKYHDSPVSCVSEDSLNVVFVIGESCILNHMSVYGYPHDTNPCMMREKEKGNLFLFSDVVSPYQKTSPTIKNLLSCNSMSDGENWSDYPYLPYLFKKAGYNIFFWDNQRDMVKGSGQALSLNSFVYNKKITPVYDKVNDVCFSYDDELISSFIKSFSLSAGGKYNFVMFHLLGQHLPSRTYYPNNGKYDYFIVDSIQRNEKWITVEKKQYIAEFDNATRYNDMVLGKMFDYFRNTRTVILYLSDHGEEVYDYRDTMGRRIDTEHITKEVIDYQFRVPFMIWISDSYRESFPQIIDLMKKGAARKFMTDNTYNVLFHLGFIKTEFYRSTHDILSEDFVPAKRLLLGKTDCDSIINEK
ncbi:MAG: phosphoethanolamine transferase [Prevotella sp.]|nr:phosphoethanolamine transferase [Prevotella sp.]